MGWCTNAIHNGVNQAFELLDAAFSEVLVLVVWFTLPISDAIGTQDLLDLVAYFDLSTVTNKLGRRSSSPNLILKGVDELPIGLDGINISN